MLQSAGIASQLNIADARDRPFFPKALHRDTSFPVGDLSAGTRDQLLVADGWHELDDQSQGRRADSPPAGIARAALRRAPVLQNVNPHVLAPEGQARTIALDPGPRRCRFD